MFSAPGVDESRRSAGPSWPARPTSPRTCRPGFEPGLEASSFFEPENFTFPFGTHIVAVEVDRDTGQVAIKKYVAVDDCGPQINPLLVEGQVQGGIAHSIGQVLFEQTIYDENGQLLTGEFMDYAMPRAADIPDYILGSTVTPSPVNPLGIKGVGEAGTIGATPAIANAVLDALEPLGHHASRFAADARARLAGDQSEARLAATANGSVRVRLNVAHQPLASGSVGLGDDMYPAHFDYDRPSTIDEALALLVRMATMPRCWRAGTA